MIVIDYDKVLSNKIQKIKPSGIRKFFDIAGTMKDVISLGVGEPDFSTPWVIRKAAIQVLERKQIVYGPNKGLAPLRTEITNMIERKHGVKYDSEDEVIVTVGGSEAIDLVLSGRADFLGTSVPVLNAYLDEHPDAKDKLKEAFVIPDSEDVIAIPVRKGETEYLDAINAALAELREEGKLKEISEKYLGGDYTESAYQ